MTFDTISISSDDDDVPLKTCATQVLETHGLKAHSIEQCEFCDEFFFNRYSALIHNAKHIIIPLLKQEVHQCNECLYYFTSQEELKHHIKTNHKHEEIRNVSNDNHVNHEKDIKTGLHMAISDIVKKELDIKLEDYIVQNKLDKTVEVKQEIKEDIIDRKHLDIIVDEKLKNHLMTETKVKINNRFRFEDDSDLETEELDDGFDVNSNGLRSDLTTECKVNMKIIDNPWVGDDLKSNANEVFGSNKVDIKGENVIIEEYSPSIHYDELVKPGMYRCKRCTKRFPTRFQLIQHDVSHVRLRKPRPQLCIFCERFITTNWKLLKQHIQRWHPSKMCKQRPLSFASCERCGLKYYNYTKHINNYHTLTYCHMCKKGFDTEEEKNVHINQHLIEMKCSQCDMVSTAIEIEEHRRLWHRVSNVSMLKLCETCCLFLKNKNNVQYVVVKSVSEIGSRLDCEHCGKKFFELKLVRRLHKRKEKDPLQDGERERKKHLSNSDRLRNIRQRLKMINKLSKC